jgi:flagellum-specific ATP synthase
MNTIELSNMPDIVTASLTGSVVQVVGMTVAVADFPAPVGARVQIERKGAVSAEGEVVGFRDGRSLVYLLSPAAGVRHGDRARLLRTSSSLKVGPGLLGRMIDARGCAIDGRPQPLLTNRALRDRSPPRPAERQRILVPFATGIRAIDALLTCGRGQRLGIFSGSGVGKSALLGMMSRYADADVIVTGLIGERGREVNEFIQRDLGPDGLARSVIVVATSDEPALARVHAASTATAIAEYFRDQGARVLLLIDSLTRVAMAQREVGLAAGEPPTTRGYPPSTFALLPRLVERSGQSRDGSITAFYTVLVEGDDENEPVADALRGLLDGHIWLARKLASRGHYPAIDVLASISRLMIDITAPQHQADAQTIRRLLATHAEHEDLLSVGAYRRGSNRAVDVAVEMRESIDGFLRQSLDIPTSYDETISQLRNLSAQCEAKLTTQPPSTGTSSTTPLGAGDQPKIDGARAGVR